MNAELDTVRSKVKKKCQNHKNLSKIIQTNAKSGEQYLKINHYLHNSPIRHDMSKVLKLKLLKYVKVIICQKVKCETYFKVYCHLSKKEKQNGNCMRCYKNDKQI